MQITYSLLNLTGRVIVSVFYEAPNATWLGTGATLALPTGAINGPAASITTA